MKKIIYTLFVTTLSGFALAQCPTTALDFGTQAELNNFPTLYPGCTVIPEGIDIKIMGNDITDLSPLSQLNGTLAVLEIRDCPLLSSLDGLDQLSFIGNDPLDGFILRELPLLNSLDHLQNLDSVTGEFTIRTCASITSLSGLDSLIKTNGSLIIRDNENLASLNGLDSLRYIGETLELVENPVLTDISALANVDTILGGIEGGVFIEANDLLQELTGLGHANTHIGSNLDLLLNGNLQLCSVPSICKYLNDPPAGAVITITGNVTNCNSETEILNLCGPLSAETFFTENLNIYPNPFNQSVSVIGNSGGTVRYELIDLSGKLLLSGISTTPFEIDGTELESGVYLLRIFHDQEVNVFQICRE